MNNNAMPAFPVLNDSVGLSKREYAAIHIMAAIAGARYPYERARITDDVIFLVDGLFDKLEQ